MAQDQRQVLRDDRPHDRPLECAGHLAGECEEVGHWEQAKLRHARLQLILSLPRLLPAPECPVESRVGLPPGSPRLPASVYTAYGVRQAPVIRTALADDGIEANKRLRIAEVVQVPEDLSPVLPVSDVLPQDPKGL